MSRTWHRSKESSALPRVWSWIHIGLGWGWRLGLGVGGRKLVGWVVGFGVLVAVQAPLISQGQRIHLQKMALQKSPWAWQTRGLEARQAVKWVPWRHQHGDLDGHDFWCACLPFAPLDMVSKPKSSAPPAEPKWAWQWLGPRARRHIGHDYSCSRRLKGPTCCPEHLSSPSPLSATGEHATLGCSHFFWCSYFLGARDCLWGLCRPAVDDLPGPALLSGSLAKWKGTASPQVCSSLARMLPCWHRPFATWARGHPATYSLRHTSCGGRSHPMVKAWPLH